MASTIMKKCLFSTRLLNKSVHELMIVNRNRNFASKLMYDQYGDPVKVVRVLHEEFSNKVKGDEVLIKMLASPVNPADINTIQGKYPVKPPLPSIPGNEGVGEIVSVGTQVQNFSEGDHVILLTNAVGTWRTHLIIQHKFVYKVPKKLGIAEAATFSVNPCTAYRLLRDFVSLKPGDTVIQNGANSAVGQNLIQISKVWGLKTVNIVRTRDDIEGLKNYLSNLGANFVLTEEELRITNIFKSGEVQKPKLGINCVGGKSSLELLRHLDKSATLVTFGGMSREPVTIPTGPLIFKDLRVRGFWMTAWSQKNAESKERMEMYEEIISMMMNGEIRAPLFKMVSFENYREALLNTMTITGKTGRKFILDFTGKSM